MVHSKLFRIKWKRVSSRSERLRKNKRKDWNNSKKIFENSIKKLRESISMNIDKIWKKGNFWGWRPRLLFASKKKSKNREGSETWRICMISMRSTKIIKNSRLKNYKNKNKRKPGSNNTERNKVHIILFRNDPRRD